MAKYREYFDIDPEYFPQVNKDIIESQPDLWKKFYPHETFVRLVKDRYMHSMDNHPRLVNVRNQEDMKSIYTHFKVGVNIFKDVSDYARNDENPSEAALFDDLRKLTGTIFVTGFTTFYKMIGEQKLRELLNKLVALTNAKIVGKIKLTDFTSFCPYDTDIDFYKDVRSEFDINEWIDILLGAMDYNSAGYEDERNRLAMLKRLLPFVEKNLNLIELAPKGTGKSYVFGNISKYGLLTDGGKVTRAKMFFDTARNTPGFIVGHDYVAIDEVKLVKFGDVNEMRSVMQGYMERGRCEVNGHEVVSDAGVVFLGNIETDNMDEYKNMLTELPSLFQESALLDRMHGFIKGWDIPPMQPGLKISGWALNTEYFCTVLHLLREDMSYRAIVDQIVEVSDGAYERHVEAVKKLTTAFLKLLFPHVKSVEDINRLQFKTYCLQPAVKMRKIVQLQLEELDPKEYKKEEKQMPTFSLRKDV